MSHQLKLNEVKHKKTLNNGKVKDTSDSYLNKQVNNSNKNVPSTKWLENICEDSVEPVWLDD